MQKITEIAPLPQGEALKAASVDLKKVAAGCRISFTKFGVKKSFTDEQKSKAAEVFDADEEFIEARRRFVDTKHEAWKAVSRTFSQAKDYWKGLTLPYPEPGVRLIRQSWVTSFVDEMDSFKDQLKEAVIQLDKHIPELKGVAKTKGGQLYDEKDWPKSFVPLFGIEYDFPTLEPPEYLKKLAPQIYEQEVQRIQARFDEAVVMAEQGFVAEFHKLVSHLTEQISGGVDGKKKVFKDASVENLAEFFDRFKALSVRSNKDLDKLVEDCQNLTKGIAPDDIRGDDKLRASLAERMAAVSKGLSEMLVVAPKRAVKRGGKHKENGKAE